MAIQAGETTFYQAKRGIVQDGLVLNLDAAVDASYSGGTTWRDLTGGNDISMANSPLFEKYNGGGFNFDGSNNYGDFGSFNITGGNNYTICIWLKTSSNIAGQNVIDHSAGASGFGVRMSDSAPRQFYHFVYDSATSDPAAVTLNTETILADTIYHFTLVIKTGNMISYVNGGSKTTGTSTSNNIKASSSNMLLGAAVGGSYGGPWAGSFYSVGIYNRVLADDEVLQNFNATRHRFGV